MIISFLEQLLRWILIVSFSTSNGTKALLRTLKTYEYAYYL